MTAEVGLKAPKFTLPVGDWKNAISLAAYMKRGLVMLCYPANWSANWSSVCTDQMEEFQVNLGRFEEKGAVVLAIGADSSCSHGAFAAGQGIGFSLLTDSNEQVIEDFGLRREAGLPERACFVIDHEGVGRPKRVESLPKDQSEVVAVLEDLDKVL